MDEFHYYSDASRGFAWQVPLLTLPQARFLLMSATLGETAFFEETLTNLTGAPTVLVKSDQRPVPLEFEYSETPLEEKVAELVEAGKAPIYLVHFTQLACADTAQNLLSSNFCTQGGKTSHRRGAAGRQFPQPLWQGDLEAAAPRHRHPPRGPAAEIPRAGRKTHPARLAQSRLRHRHARRGRERADPHRVVHPACSNTMAAVPRRSPCAISNRSPAAPAAAGSTPAAPSSPRRRST